MNKEIQFDRALLALAEIYISIYEFNMVENILQPIKSNQYIDALAEPFEGAQEKLNNVMKNITVAEHVDMIMSFSSLIYQRLKKELATRRMYLQYLWERLTVGVVQGLLFLNVIRLVDYCRFYIR